MENAPRAWLWLHVSDKRHAMLVQWFGDLQSYLIENVDDYVELINDPRCIFNCDESSFPLQPKKPQK